MLTINQPKEVVRQLFGTSTTSTWIDGYPPENPEQLVNTLHTEEYAHSCPPERGVLKRGPSSDVMSCGLALRCTKMTSTAYFSILPCGGCNVTSRLAPADKP